MKGGEEGKTGYRKERTSGGNKRTSDFEEEEEK